MTLSQYRIIREVDDMDYVAFSPEFLYQMANMIRSGIGAVFSVGLYVFILLIGLFAFMKLVFGVIE